MRECAPARPSSRLGAGASLAFGTPASTPRLGPCTYPVPKRALSDETRLLAGATDGDLLREQLALLDAQRRASGEAATASGLVAVI